MANPTGGKAAPTAPKKKKKAPTNWKQVIIVGAMALVLLSMAAPGLIRLTASLFGGGSRAEVYPGSPSEAAAPGTNNPAPPMEEPQFVKEGELSFVSADGKPITRIEIEKADNDADRMFGMMFRKSMPENRGMLFLFDRSEQQGFWMKNTLIPLDIMFVDENKVITTIHENAVPMDETTLPSNGPAKYVVEVNGGYAKRHGIKVGDRVSW
jgi:hypothetical protein